jgi:hypothetical protein
VVTDNENPNILKNNIPKALLWNTNLNNQKNEEYQKKRSEIKLNPKLILQKSYFLSKNQIVSFKHFLLIPRMKYKIKIEIHKDKRNIW